MTTAETYKCVADSGSRIAKAITADAAPGRDAYDNTVASLTEAVMGITEGLRDIALAIGDLAEAVAHFRDE